MENGASKDCTRQSIRIKKEYIVVLTCVVLFLPYLFLGPVTSESGDDMAMNLIATGAFGEQSQYLVYNNILYGYFLKFLYLLFPGVNCYLLMQFVCNLFAITAICLCITDKLNSWKSVGITMLLHFFFSFEFYEKIQFTENAFLYALTSFLLLYTGMFKQEKVKLYRAAAVAFLVLSGLIRIKGMLMMLPFGLLLMFAEWKKDEKLSDYLIRHKYVFMILGAGVALCILNAGVDQLLFWQREPWKSYNEYHQEGTVPILDADSEPELDYERMEADGTALEDVYLVYNHQYLDFTHFNLDYLKKMQTYRTDKRKTPGETLKSMLLSAEELFAFPKHYNGKMGEPEGIIKLLAGVESLLGWNLLLWCVILHGMLRNKKVIIPMVFVMLGALAEFLLFFIIGYAPHRVLMGPRLAAEIICTALVLLNGSKIQDEDKNGTQISWQHALVMAFFAAMVLCGRLSWQGEAERKTETKLVLDDLRQIPGEYYLLDGGILWGERLGFRDLRKLNRRDYKDYFAKFALSGGWIAETEHNLHFFRDNGMERPLRMLADDQHLHYVVRSYRAELYVPWIGAYLEKEMGCELRANAIYAGEELMVVDYVKE